MGFEKVEKKLPAEILAIIDEESAKLGISRQEAISRLIHSVISLKNETETEKLRLELKSMSKYLAMKDEEISYLRTELSSMNQGLSKLAENLANKNTSSFEMHALFTPLHNEIGKLSGELDEVKEKIETPAPAPYEKHIPLIIIGILSCLVIIYLIMTIK